MARKKPRGDGTSASPSAPAHPDMSGAPGVPEPSAEAIFSLPGALTIHGVRDVRTNLLQRVELPELTIDLQSVREVDTAGVQLLVALRRARLGAGATLHWRGEPGVVAVAARALGLADELALTGEA